MINHLQNIIAAVKSGNNDLVFEQVNQMAELATAAQVYKMQSDLAWQASDKLASFIKNMAGSALDDRLPLTGIPYVDATVVWPMRWKVMQTACQEFEKLYREIESAKADLEKSLEDRVAV